MAKEKHWFKDTIDWARRIQWIWVLFPTIWKAALWAGVVGLVTIAFARLNELTAAHWWIFFLMAVGIYVVVWVVVHRYAHSPSSKNSSSKQQELGLSALRPRIVAVRYGTRASDNRSGLFLVNEGEPAYDVTVTNVDVGTSKLVFHRDIPRLVKSDGEHLCETWIEKSPRNGSLGSGLFNEMVLQHIDEIEVVIRYKDGDNRRFITRGSIERDVREKGGLVIRYVRQEEEASLTARNHREELAPNDPQILMEYRWQDSGDYEPRDKLNKSVMLRNGGVDVAVNVQIGEIAFGDWKATFPLIPHILSGHTATVQASVEYDGMQIEAVANNLISLLRPPTNAGMRESRLTPARVTYTNARGDRFLGDYEFRWDHNKRECIAILIRLRRVAAA